MLNVMKYLKLIKTLPNLKIHQNGTKYWKTKKRKKFKNPGNLKKMLSKLKFKTNVSKSLKSKKIVLNH